MIECTPEKCGAPETTTYLVMSVARGLRGQILLTDSLRPLGVDAILLTVGNSRNVAFTVLGRACMT